MAAPAIFWVSAPVRPNETVLLAGGGFGGSPTVEAARLDDSPVATPGRSPKVDRWETIRPLQASDQSVKFVVPAAWKMGAFAARVVNGQNRSAVTVINAADPWWTLGDSEAYVTPGGWLRVFGRALHFDPASVALLQPREGKPLMLTASQADGYALRFEVPANAPLGEYAVCIHNGFGGDAAWASVGTINIRTPAAWKTDVFNVKDFGPNPGEALLAALKKAEANGGGIVFLPRGRYPVKDRLVIPSHTVLKGEATELVSLYWPDFEQPPAQLLTGTSFGIESLTLYCQNHKHVVADTAASEGTFLRHVRIRANCYFMIQEAGKKFRERSGPMSHLDCGAAVFLQGRNFEVTDCDIYASNYALRTMGAKMGVIARNRLFYGGRGYSIENADRLIFEDNLVSGNNLLAVGNDITTFWNNYCRNIYFAHNRLQQMFGADREMMTLDAGGGAYFGKIASVAGTMLTLAADPVFHDYAPKPHTNWEGAAVMILDGTGAGQYRLVTSNTGRAWELDRSWDIPPDETSRISIAPFRGRNLFVGNECADGGAFQLYGSAHDTIVADNKGSRMDGFLVWGLNPHGWGPQPSWFCQFLDNEIVEGNGYGPRTASFGIIAEDDSKVYDGPMVRCVIFRRNQVRNNASFHIAGQAADILVEHCTVRHAGTGISVRMPAQGVVLRENILEDVDQPLQGDGLDRAVVVPKPQPPSPK